MRTPLLLTVLALATSCGEEPASPPPAPKGSCSCIAPEEPWTDEATLTPYTTDQNFLGSVISFQWATTVDHGEVLNDWDLSLTPDTATRDNHTFRVNLVTDDRSCIEDLGPIAIANVPATISHCDDNVRVVEGHVYLVENRDVDQQQFAAFAVTKLDGVRSATLRWYRSSQPDRFTFEH
jgi:hypothetical protein